MPSGGRGSCVLLFGPLETIHLNCSVWMSWKMMEDELDSRRGAKSNSHLSM